jgi:hypothetical protein
MLLSIKFATIGVIRELVNSVAAMNAIPEEIARIMGERDAITLQVHWENKTSDLILRVRFRFIQAGFPNPSK